MKTVKHHCFLLIENRKTSWVVKKKSWVVKTTAPLHPLIMKRSFKPGVRIASNKRHYTIRPTILTNFNTEQSSDNYISSLCKRNLFREALDAFELLQKNTNIKVKRSTYAHLFSACSTLRSLRHGKIIHNHLLSSKFQPDVALQNHILNMYGKCGSFRDAGKVFDEMSERNCISWTSIIAGYSQNGQEKEAIILYLEMLKSGILPDHFTFGSIIKACSGLSNVGLGKQAHAHVTKSEFGSQVIPRNALISMYVKFDQIDDAWNLFSRIESKDVISWGSMIAGFSQLGYEVEALSWFKEMLLEGIYWPNEFIFGSCFSACSSLVQAECGEQIHGMAIKLCLERNNFVACSLCDLYAKCGYLNSAKKVFYQIERPDIASWNAIIAGFSNGGAETEAMSFFSQMTELGLNPDDVTLCSILCASSSPFDLKQVKQVHSYITKMGFHLYVQVCNSLLTMYAKCANLLDAFHVFEDMSNLANLVSWNSIITACLQHKQARDVFKLFKLMLVSYINLDYITSRSISGACAEVSSLEMGNQFHCYSIKNGLNRDSFVTNGLIDMYTKLGSLEIARKLFDSMENPNVISWSSMIVGYAQFGYGEEALNLFKSMTKKGYKPNEVTFVGVLTACSHIGLIEEGLQFYRNMELEHQIVPTLEHCSCMVDLFARAGLLKEAEDFINQMPFEPDVLIWKTLLSACKTYKNVNMGKRVAENILRIDPFNSTAHVLLSNIYASEANWEEFARLRSLMKTRGVRKNAGCSWIEIKDTIHVFLVEDLLHSEREKIYCMLDDLWLQMLDAG